MLKEWPRFSLRLFYEPPTRQELHYYCRHIAAEIQRQFTACMALAICLPTIFILIHFKCTFVRHSYNGEFSFIIFSGYPTHSFKILKVAFAETYVLKMELRYYFCAMY